MQQRSQIITDLASIFADDLDDLFGQGIPTKPAPKKLPYDKRAARGRPEKYLRKDGTQVTGVTTILSRFKESGALMYWAHQQGLAGKTLYEERDEASEVGKLVHDMVENDIRGEPMPEIPKEYRVRCYSGFRSWKSWCSNRNMKIVATEHPLVSEVHPFGGTLDAMEDIDGLSLIDWKTSSGVYVDYLMQIAAYGILWEEAYPDNPITGGYHLVRFSKTHGDMEHRFWPELEDAADEFIYLAYAYEKDKLVKKRLR